MIFKIKNKLIPLYIFFKIYRCSKLIYIKTPTKKMKIRTTKILKFIRVLKIFLLFFSTTTQKETMSFFIGTGPLQQTSLNIQKDYENLLEELNKEITLTNVVTHFKIPKDSISGERILMNIILRKATYIYLFYSNDERKPNFKATDGNVLEVSLYDKGDHIAGKMMEDNLYVDIPSSSSIGSVSKYFNFFLVI